MKTFRLNIIALLSIIPLLNGCSDFLSGIGSSNYSLRPAAIDLDNVTGFVVVDNSQDAATKSGTSEVSQALYSIDKNGDIKITIFYFEPVEEDGKTPNETIMKEISNALQVVPSLVTDLGKYILFSGCQFQIVNSDISDKARNVCETFVQQNHMHPDIVYMIRKSDGALFDLTDKFFFSYSHPDWEDEKYYPHYDSPEFYISPKSYFTSAKNNLFVNSAQPNAIFRVEDNGDAVDFRQMTQETSFCERFAIDTDENIYHTNWMNNGYGKEIYIYGANSKFYLYKFDYEVWLIDLITDSSGVPYIFVITADREVTCARFSNCDVDIVSKKYFDNTFYNYKNHMYLGYYDDCHKWCDYSSILSYNTKTNDWGLRNVSEDILQVLSANHDAIVYGSKTYCATVKGSSVKVTEIDFISETMRTYTLDVDMTSIIPTTYRGRMSHNVPYMTIEGRSPVNGASVTFTIDLINGDNNSTFAPDGRNVVSFFRIN